MEDKNSGLSVKKTFIAVIAVVAFIIVGSMGGSIVETNNKGQFQVKQAAVSGTMSVRTNAGMYLQNFGSIKTWNKAETFYFTADNEEGANRDESIEVRFNDGSLCNISGTMRVSLPRTETEILSLVEALGYMSYDDLENKLIRPAVRNALRLTANLMTARESYAERRTDFNSWAWDQIQNGLYKTKDVVVTVKDEITGEVKKKTVKQIRTNKDGSPMYGKNPLGSTGIQLSNFEVKVFVYSDTVKDQISAQQKAYMSIATAKAEAAKAQQDKLKAEAEGKANVAKAEAKALVEKKTAVVKAQREKKVAELSAEKKYKVAQFAAKEALEEAKKIRANGMAKAAANQALVRAGLTPLKRAELKRDTAIGVARELAKINFPKIMSFGNEGKSGPLQALEYNQMFDLVNKMSKSTP